MECSRVYFCSSEIRSGERGEFWVVFGFIFTQTKRFLLKQAHSRISYMIFAQASLKTNYQLKFLFFLLKGWFIFVLWFLIIIYVKFYFIYLIEKSFN